MEKIAQLGRLESRQLELQMIMAKSDAHASKCTKLGLNFAETYPSDLEEYEAARQEYNDNEVLIAELRAEIEAEKEEAPVNIPEEPEG